MFGIRHATYRRVVVRAALGIVHLNRHANLNSQDFKGSEQFFRAEVDSAMMAG